MEWKKFTFYGLGLIGGSLAKAIRKYYPNAMISAIEKNPYAIECAKKEGILNRELYNASEIEADTDILFLCAPVEWNRAFLKEIKPYLSKKTILTDVGSTKSSIMEEANTLRLSAQFCGGHPMAGAEISGFSASDPLLLQNAYYILTPGIDFPKAKLDALTVFLASIGSIPYRMNPEEHDRTVAMVSHLPHLLAAGLVTLLKEEDQDGKMKKLAAGGFKDITRIASSSPLMWQQICMSNKDAIVEMMDDYLHLLEKIKDQSKKKSPKQSPNSSAKPGSTETQWTVLLRVSFIVPTKSPFMWKTTRERFPSSPRYWPPIWSAYAISGLIITGRKGKAPSKSAFIPEKTVQWRKSSS